MKKPFIIGVTGGSGSGKTTFIKRLRDAFSEDELCIISQDDYYIPREQQALDTRGVVNFDRPESINKKEFQRDVEKLIAGESIEREEYTFNNQAVEPRMLRIKSAPVIIVEGIFVFHYKKIRKLLDLKIFLHAKENLKVIRRIKRDQMERNYPIDDVLYRYEHHVLPTFEKYIKPYQDKADIVINNNKHFEVALDLIMNFVEVKNRKR